MKTYVNQNVFWIFRRESFGRKRIKFNHWHKKNKIIQVHGVVIITQVCNYVTLCLQWYGDDKSGIIRIECLISPFDHIHCVIMRFLNFFLKWGHPYNTSRRGRVKGGIALLCVTLNRNREHPFIWAKKRDVTLKISFLKLAIFCINPNNLTSEK